MRLKPILGVHEVFFDRIRAYTRIDFAYNV